MTWQPVVVGVDTSPEGAQAAAAGWGIAQTAGAGCHLLHVVREPSHIDASTSARNQTEQLMKEMLRAAQRTVEETLAPAVPPQALEHLEVRSGNAAWVLAQAVADLGAGLLVLGGKHHAAPVRWFGGSTVHHVVRTVDVPLLVTTTAAHTFDRVLVAVDLSEAAPATLRGALDFAAPFGAAVRVLHVVEPLPSIPDVGIQLDEGEHLRLAEAGTTELIAALDLDVPVEQVVRCGAPARMVAEEVSQWGGDLVVVGTHGKGWVDRVLLGSTTERLLNRLPCSVLVIPVGSPKPNGDRERKGSA